MSRHEDGTYFEPTHGEIVANNPLLLFVSERRAVGIEGFKVYQRPKETDPIIMAGEA